VRTDRWSYIRWLAQDSAVEELYEILTDPKQQQNLAGKQEYQATLEQLRQRWAQLRKELE
jgi:RNA polymerase-interacting CarD/CdnL/TRCF family regulator